MPQYNPYEDALSNLRKLQQGYTTDRPGTELLTDEDLAPQAPLSPGGPASPPDVGLTRSTYLDRMGRELDERLYRAQAGNDPLQEKAVQGLMAANTRDIAENPMTQQIADIRDTEAQQHKAVLGGFRTPQDMAKFGQELEVGKVTSPANVARITGAADLARQREASSGALGVAKEQNIGMANQYQAMRDLLATGTAPRSLSMSRGSASVTMAPEVNKPTPTVLLQAVNKARDAYNNSTFDMGNKLKKNLDGAIATAVSQWPAEPELKTQVMSIVNDPQYAQYANLPVEQIIPLFKGEDGSDPTPEEADAIRGLLLMIRGR